VAESVNEEEIVRGVEEGDAQEGRTKAESMEICKDCEKGKGRDAQWEAGEKGGDGEGEKKRRGTVYILDLCAASWRI
jgi:hypothetical protein